MNAEALFRFVARRDVSRLPVGALVHDVSSRAKPPFVKLSPFYPHGLIPVPGLDRSFSDSVEGVWQGLKLLNGQIDTGFFSGKGRKRRGKPQGHKFGDRVLGYVEARRVIYVPTYEYMWQMCIGRDLRAFFFKHADRGRVQYFFDYENNGDLADPRAPLAHSSILVKLLAEEWAHQHSEAAHSS